MISLNHIKDSTVTLYLNVRRAAFFVDRTWLRSLRRINYGQEMQLRFIPELHQDHKFERDYLQDILAYPSWIKRGSAILGHAIENLDSYADDYREFQQVVNADGLEPIDPPHPVLKMVHQLFLKAYGLREELGKNAQILSKKKYSALEYINRLGVEMPGGLKTITERVSITQVFNKRPVNDDFLLIDLVSSFNRTLTAINRAITWLNNFQNTKIIAGIAGTGKSHAVGHLIHEIEKLGDYVIFLNAKAFNGDNVNFEACINQKLFIPHGYRLNESLSKLNRFAKKKGKRLFIMFDALNETTTSNLGFSRIWKDELSGFINLIKDYPHLYFLCTLRTSYIDEVWDQRPENVAILNGVDLSEETRKMCRTYFDHYHIAVDNFDTADLSQFKVPLLLDLFCKMTNNDRGVTKRITLDGKSYQEVFKGYIDKLVQDVRKRRNLLLPDAIREGLDLSSLHFMNNNEATVSLKDFVLSFDSDGLKVKEHESIAGPMLEGNLVFLKERVAAEKEIVKHTQQLIGGYLLAAHLVKRYPLTGQLVASDEFRTQIDSNDPATRHQLRLDIMKFLVISNPDVVNHISEIEAFREGWWFLYNGYDEQNAPMAIRLLQNPLSSKIMPYVMQTSIEYWFDPGHPYNFNYIAKYLMKFGTWELDANWAFYIYNHAEQFFTIIADRKDMLSAAAISLEGERLFGLFAASITSTTVRELRDLATVYLLEFGKRFPLELLEITKICADIQDSYIYQRAIQALYGVGLNLQHQPEFVNNVLPVIAETVFQLQFSTQATNPVYDYIVIDAIKHLLDLAVHKKVWGAADADMENIAKFRVPNLTAWEKPNEDVIAAVRNCTEMNPPEPIGMDFGIYTIPTLLESGRYELKPQAMANVLGRVRALGYLSDPTRDSHDRRFPLFVYGNALDRTGKVDKLGKKYNWKAFFDYAGYLLQTGQLDTFKKSLDISSGFNRLSDVEIDISLPNRNYAVSEEFFDHELIPADRPQGWSNEVKVQLIDPYLIKEFEGIPYVMLKGVVENRIDENYKVRSFIMVESCLIKKNQNFDRLKLEVAGQIFDWDRDLHLSLYSDTCTYFGEYYWADNQMDGDLDHYSVKTGKKIKKVRKIRPSDLFSRELGFKRADIGEEFEQALDELIGFEGEPTLIQYLNESSGEYFKGFGMYLPTAKIGKHLGLTSDPLNGQINDEEGKQALITVHYNQNLVKNEATYLRLDLLRRYSSDHGYAILYQNKQHSYDYDQHHLRNMTYKVIEL